MDNNHISAQIQTVSYLNNLIQFEVRNGQVMANATLMCQAFGKRFSDWHKTDLVKRYIQAITGKIVLADNQLVVIRNGGSDSGSWIHEKLVIKLAQWLDVDFEIWCDEKIAELLRTGKVTLDPRNLSRMDLINIAKEAETENIQLRQEVAILTPKAEYTDKVLSSLTTYTITQVAKALNMTAIELNQFLVMKGVQFKVRNGYVLTANYQSGGYAKVVTRQYQRPDYTIGTSMQLEWTETGRRLVFDMIIAFRNNLFASPNSEAKNLLTDTG